MGERESGIWIACFLFCFVFFFSLSLSLFYENRIAFESLRTGKYKPKIRIVLDFGKKPGKGSGKKLV